VSPEDLEKKIERHEKMLNKFSMIMMPINLLVGCWYILMGLWLLGTWNLILVSLNWKMIVRNS
jgi:hypothetical protein